MQESGIRLLSVFLSLIIQSFILSCIVSRLVVSPIFSPSSAHLGLRQKLSRISLATYWLWLSFFGSWCFVIALEILQYGTTITEDHACTAAIFVCIWLYGLTKIVIYLFLTERAHVVRGGTRLNDRIYWLNVSLALGPAIIAVLCVVTRYIRVTENHCVIAIRRNLNVAYVIYDLFVTCFWTVQFLTPLYRVSPLRTNWRLWRKSFSAQKSLNTSSEGECVNRTERQLYTLAQRTAIGSVLCMIVTVANAIQVAVMFGKEDVTICLLACSLDVGLNCIILHFVTNGRHGTDESLETATASSPSLNSLRISDTSILRSSTKLKEHEFTSVRFGNEEFTDPATLLTP